MINGDFQTMLSMIRVSRLSNLTSYYSPSIISSRLISLTTIPAISPLIKRVTIPPISSSSFLSPTPSIQVQSTAGLKAVGQVEKRCRHCYTVIQDEVKYNLCTAKPRHRQVQKQVATKFGNMILTHGTQGTKRSNGRGTRHMKTQQSFRLDFE